MSEATVSGPQGKEGERPMATVSVVIPVWGVERYLDACLESVCAQSLRDIEVICVDDCSPDACPTMLDAWAQADERIRVLHLPENHGQGYARNRGLECATGTYVYFLDSDDMIEPTTLEELSAIADADDLDALFFDSRPVFDTPALARRNASYPARHKGTYPNEATDGYELFCSFVRQNDWTCYVQRQLWRRVFLVQEGICFPDASAHEDEAFAFEALVSARRARYVPRDLFVRRYREGSVMTTPPTARGLYSYFVGYVEMVRFARAHGLDAPEVSVNLQRIHRALVRHRATLLAQGEDLDRWFVHEPWRTLWQFFDEEQRGTVHTLALSDALVERTLAADHVYVYGAGVLARDVHESLVQAGVAIDAFLVTSIQGNPATLAGHRVLSLEEAKRPDGDTLVVISVTDGYRAEIECLLDQAGWSHWYCKE